MTIVGGNRVVTRVRTAVLWLLTLATWAPGSARAQDDPFAMWRKVLITLDGHALNGNVFGDGLFGPSWVSTWRWSSASRWFADRARPSTAAAPCWRW